MDSRIEQYYQKQANNPDLPQSERDAYRRALGMEEDKVSKFLRPSND